jgi:hypothetical protein
MQKTTLKIIIHLYIMKKIKYILFVLLILILAGCSSTNEITIVPRKAWNAVNPKPYNSQIPVRITIHHEGEYFNPDSNAAKFIKKVQVWGMSKARNWSDIPYHFLIGLDGTIYEGRNVFTEGETATEYNPDGHLLISCIGNFEVQEVPKAQLNSLIKLIAYCCKKYQISPDSIASHRDYSNMTVCPGKNLYKYVKNNYIKDQVKKLLN